MIAAMLIRLVYNYQCIPNSFIGPDINSYGFTEIFINYRGGFVRRGLLGEVLLLVCSITNFSPIELILALSFSLYLGTLIFFIVKFRKQDYSILILASVLLFGYVNDIIRKDFLLYLLLIIGLWIIKSNNTNYFKEIAVTLIIIIALLIHESFIFFGVPALLILMWSELSNKERIAVLSSVAICLSFLILSTENKNINLFGISSSWNNILDEGYKLYPTKSIGALKWDFIETARNHFTKNLRFDEVWNFLGIKIPQAIIVRPVEAVLAYYLVVNYFSVFRGCYSNYKKIDAAYIGAIYIIIAICMLPMFTFLSCDYARLFQTQTVVVIATYLLIPRHMLAQSLPKKIVRFAERVNTSLCKIKVPDKITLALIMMIWGVSPYEYDFDDSWEYSPVGTLIYSTQYIIKML